MPNNYAGFDDAPVYDRLPGFETGKYVVEVVELATFASKTEDGDYFKGRYRIIEASPGSGNQPGDEVAEVLPLFGTNKKTFFGVARSVVGAITQEPGSKVSNEDFNEATASDNPCAGHKAKVIASKAMKKNGEEYVRASFAPYNAPLSA